MRCILNVMVVGLEMMLRDFGPGDIASAAFVLLANHQSFVALASACE